MGFECFVASALAILATGLRLLPGWVLTPTEHAQLCWTHYAAAFFKISLSSLSCRFSFCSFANCSAAVLALPSPCPSRFRQDWTQPYSFHIGSPSSRATSAVLLSPARAKRIAVSLNSSVCTVFFFFMRVLL